MFLQEMLQQLPRISGKPMCEKIFRIYRDVRFSKDKTPYNAHVRMSFFCSDEQKTDCGATSAFYFSLQPKKVFTPMNPSLNVYQVSTTKIIPEPSCCVVKGWPFGTNPNPVQYLPPVQWIIVWHDTKTWHPCTNGCKRCKGENQMPYDPGLAQRLEEVLLDHPEMVETKMFGGICYMLNGNMCVGIYKNTLIVRIGEQQLAIAFVKSLPKK